MDISSYEYIIQMINSENLDVLCLQEAVIKSEYLPSIAEYIKQNSELKYSIQYELSDSHINIGCKMGCNLFKVRNKRF